MKKKNKKTKTKNKKQNKILVLQRDNCKLRQTNFSILLFSAMELGIFSWGPS